MMPVGGYWLCFVVFRAGAALPICGSRVMTSGASWRLAQASYSAVWAGHLAGPGRVASSTSESGILIPALTDAWAAADAGLTDPASSPLVNGVIGV